MNLPLDFNSAEPWTRIVKIALTIAAVYAIAVVGLFGKGNFLGGAVLLVFGLAFSAVLRRARRVSMGAAGRLTASAVTVQLLGRAGIPTIDVMTDDIEKTRPFAEELSAALNLKLESVAVPGQTIRRYTM